MAYCTVDDLKLVLDEPTLVQLTDDEVLSTDPLDLAQAMADNAKVSPRLTAVLNKASAIVNGAIRVKYSVPLATTPPYINHLATELAVGLLFQRRSHSMNGVPEWVAKRYDTAMKDVRLIRSGKLDPGVDPPPAPSVAVIADVDGPGREFTAEKMEDF